MKKSKSGLRMARSSNSNDEARLRVVKEELDYFGKLVKGHQKILQAIGKM
jgi:hypothetical protein